MKKTSVGGAAEDDDDNQSGCREKMNNNKTKPFVYNNFMKKEMAAIKAADPSLKHKEVFKLAASRVTHT